MSKNLWKFALVVALIVPLLPLVATAEPTLRQGFHTGWDGTQIRYNLFLPESASSTNRVPIVLRTHGWGGTGETSVSGTLKALLDSGYAVLTWDQRGFGQSGGQVEIDHPDWEGRDVMSLIDFAADQPEILKRSVRTPGTKTKVFDPVVGMSGGSYAGGIQLMAASIDGRIDAIAPEIAWNDLPRSIFPNGVPKFGWDALLYGSGQTALTGGLPQGETGNYNPEIHRSFFQVAATNDPSPFNAFYDERSPKHYVDNIKVPTLIIQGTIDTLFTITEGVNNFEQIRDNPYKGSSRLPVKLLLYNSGHTLGSSIPAGDATARARAAVVSWFDRYLKGADTSTGPLVEYQDNFAGWHSSGIWPIGKSLSVSGSVPNLPVTPFPGGGSLTAGNPNYTIASARSEVLTADSDGTMIVGVPRLTGTATGVGAQAFLFFKLVNATTGQVLNDQVTALSLSLLGGSDEFDIELEGVSSLLGPGEELILEISTGSTMYSGNRTPALVNLDFDLTLPVS